MEDYYFLGAVSFVLLLILFTIVGIYNGIISRKNLVERSWADVITQELQKTKIIDKLSELVKDYKDFEDDVQSRITKYRSSTSSLDKSSLEIDKLKNTESEYGKVVAGFNLVAEAYPDLKTSEVFINLMDEISNQQDNVAAAIRIFNSGVESFNTGIEVFPNNLVNGALNKEVKISTFSDEESSSNFSYKPNF